jgi:hypothetical protein
VTVLSRSATTSSAVPIYGRLLVPSFALAQSKWSSGVELMRTNAMGPVSLLDDGDLDRVNGIPRIPVRLGFAGHVGRSYRKTNPARTLQPSTK